MALALKEIGWDVGFASSASTQATAPDTSEIGRVVTMPDDLAEELQALRASWDEGVDVLVIDHYGRDDRYEALCRSWASYIVAIDDLPTRQHDADILLDQTLGRSAGEYRNLVAKNTQFLVGAEYILLRKDVRTQIRETTPTAAVANSVVVTFGGSDRSNLTGRASMALADPRFNDFAAVFVVGPAYAFREQLMANVPANVKVVFNPDNFPAILAAADIAISAAGTTCWELAYLGVPALVVKASPGNVAQSLDAAGVAEWIGCDEDIDAAKIADALALLAFDRERLEAMSAAGRRLVDGQGADRAAAAIDNLLKQCAEKKPSYNVRPDSISLRDAQDDDEDRILQWRNDPLVVSRSSTGSAVALHEHKRWFQDRLKDVNCKLQIIEIAGRAVGSIRFDRTDSHTSVISINLVESFTGKGYGVEAIRQASAEVMAQWDTDIVAYVRADNYPSKKAFARAGFQEITRRDSPPNHFVFCLSALD